MKTLTCNFFSSKNYQHVKNFMRVLEYILVLREVNPSCRQVKCVMHRLALCIEHAFEKVPSSVSTLMCRIPAHFS